jgi:transcriptional regulator with XRE-family HTH domain
MSSHSTHDPIDWLTYDVPVSVLGDNIRHFRNKLGWSQERLAKRFRKTRGAVSQWETGDTRPAIEELPVLSKIFKVSIARLMGVDTTLEDELLDLEEEAAERLRASFKAQIKYEKQRQSLR